MRIFSDIGLGDRFMNNAHLKGILEKMLMSKKVFCFKIGFW